MDDLVPEYEVLEDAFFEPDLIRAGSRIRTHMSPGAHLRPLNDAARAKMELWYNEEMPMADKEGRPILLADGTPKMFKPHLAHRPFTAGGLVPEREEVELVAGPARDTKTHLTLAELQLAKARATSQRPPPKYEPNTSPDIAKAPGELAPTAQVTLAAPAKK